MRWYLECTVKVTKERRGPYCGIYETNKPYSTCFGLNTSSYEDREQAKKEVEERYLKEKRGDSRLCSPKLVWREHLDEEKKLVPQR